MKSSVDGDGDDGDEVKEMTTVVAVRMMVLPTKMMMVVMARMVTVLDTVMTMTVLLVMMR